MKLKNRKKNQKIIEKAAKEEIKKIYKECGLTEDGYLPEEVNILRG